PLPAGVYAGKGRPRSMPEEEIRRRHAAGEGPTAIARALQISRRSVYRALKHAASPETLERPPTLE
ncbi:resolvase, partial [Methylobacterium radiotolerans]